MDKVDTYVPLPPRDVDKPFLMPIEDIFSIQGRGTVVTGRIEKGICKVGEKWKSWFPRHTQDGGDWRGMFKKLWTRRAGDNVGLLLARIERRRGARPGGGEAGIDQAHKKFKGEIYVLSKEEGAGTHRFQRDRPQFYFRTTDVTGRDGVARGSECNAGDNVGLWWS